MTNQCSRLEMITDVLSRYSEFSWNFNVLSPSVREIVFAGHDSIRFDMSQKGSDWVKKHFSDKKIYEPITSFLISELQTVCMNNCFLDVGSANGYFSLIAASRKESRMRIDAFEIRPSSIQEFKNAVDFNQHLPVDDIHLHHAALSDNPGTMQDIWYYKTKLFLQKPTLPEYQESLSRRLKYALRGKSDYATLKTARIPVDSIDSVCEELRLKPGLLKIDVDGFEARVLPGGLQTFAKFHPIIVLEIHRESFLAPFKVTRQELVQMLLDAGYEAILIEEHRDVSKVSWQMLNKDDLPSLRTNTTDLMVFF